MPNINRPSKNRTILRTKDGDTWEPFNEKQVEVMIEAFMIINKQVIWNKDILKTCNCTFAKLKGRKDFAAVWKDPDVWVSLNSNSASDIFGMAHKKEISIPIRLFSTLNPARIIAATLIHELATSFGRPGGGRTARRLRGRCRRAGSTTCTTRLSWGRSGGRPGQHGVTPIPRGRDRTSSFAGSLA